MALALPRPHDHHLAVGGIVVGIDRATEDGFQPQQRKLLAAHRDQFAAADAVDAHAIAAFEQDFAHRAPGNREILPRRAHHQHRYDRPRHLYDTDDGHAGPTLVA